MPIPGRRRRRPRNPAQYVVVAFVAASLLGGLLLTLPVASEGYDRVPFLTALFTATSAVCVTGLVVVDTAAQYSAFGEAVIMVLMKLGGLGIMTATSLIVLLLAGRMGLRHRVAAAAESGTLVLGDMRRLVIGVAKFSLAVEAVVATALFLRFWLSHDEPAARAAYLGVFHSVSSFNNAGFALFSDNFVGFARDPVVLIVLALSVIVGGLGYPAWVEIARSPRRARRWSLHTKLTVLTSGVLIASGALLLCWFEWANPSTLGNLSTVDRIVNAFFHSAASRTAGFNTVDVAALNEPSLLLTEALMFIGGGAGSTAGGIKVTTFAVLGLVMWAEARGNPDVVAFRRRIPVPVQRQAVTVALLALVVLVAATTLLTAVTGLPRDELLFEAVSALGTVGLSTGATPQLNEAGQLVVIGMMILGRVGPITLVAALVLRERARLFQHPEERPIIG